MGIVGIFSLLGICVFSFVLPQQLKPVTKPNELLDHAVQASPQKFREKRLARHGVVSLPESRNRKGSFELSVKYWEDCFPPKSPPVVSSKNPAQFPGPVTQLQRLTTFDLTFRKVAQLFNYQGEFDPERFKNFSLSDGMMQVHGEKAGGCCTIDSWMDGKTAFKTTYEISMNALPTIVEASSPFRYSIFRMTVPDDHKAPLVVFPQFYGYDTWDLLLNDLHEKGEITKSMKGTRPFAQGEMKYEGEFKICPLSDQIIEISSKTNGVCHIPLPKNTEINGPIQYRYTLTIDRSNLFIPIWLVYDIIFEQDFMGQKIITLEHYELVG